MGWKTHIKTMSVLLLTFLTLSILIAYATSFPVSILDTMTLSVEGILDPFNPFPQDILDLGIEGILDPLNPYPLETVNMTIEGIKHPFNPHPREIMSLGVEAVLMYYPTIGQFYASTPVYPDQYVLIRCNVDDKNGREEIVNATVQLTGNIILKWVNSTNTFSESYDPSGYCTLSVGECTREIVNATAYRLSWKVKFIAGYGAGWKSVVVTNTKVFDEDGLSGTNSHVNLFEFQIPDTEESHPIQYSLTYFYLPLFILLIIIGMAIVMIKDRRNN